MGISITKGFLIWLIKARCQTPSCPFGPQKPIPVEIAVPLRITGNIWNIKQDIKIKATTIFLTILLE
jgi:hypothetical protein